MYKLGNCILIDTCNTKNIQYDMVSPSSKSSYDNVYINNYAPTLLDNEIYYDFIQLNNGKYDLLYIDSDNEIEFPNTNNNLPDVWGNTTDFFAKFNGNLNAGNLDFSVENLDYVLIMRREVNSNNNQIFDPVNIIRADDFIRNEGAIIYDRFVQCNHEYEYKAIPVLLDGTESTSLYAKYKDNDNKIVNWMGHYIFDGKTEYHCSLETSLSWSRNQSSSIVNLITGKYPYSVNFNKNNYDTISISGTHLKVDCAKDSGFDIDATAEYNQSYDDFITNRKPKLIRDWTGRMWIAQLDGNVDHNADDYYLHITTSHSFVEIANPKDNEALYRYGFTDYNPLTMINGNISSEVSYGATLRIKVIDGSNSVYTNNLITLFLNNIEIWQCRTDSNGIATITNLDAGFYTVQVGSGVYSIKKYISINSSSTEVTDITIKVGG